MSRDRLEMLLCALLIMWRLTPGPEDVVGVGVAGIGQKPALPPLLDDPQIVNWATIAAEVPAELVAIAFEAATRAPPHQQRHHVGHPMCVVHVVRER